MNTPSVGCLWKYSFIVWAVLSLSACANPTVLSGIEGFTNAVEGFTERVKSQNTLKNNSTVDFSGSYTFGEVAISAATSQVLTPVQLDDVRSGLRIRVIRANDANDIPTLNMWGDVQEEIEDQFTTLNEVIVFKVENKGFDDLDASEANILFTTSQGARKEHVVLSDRALTLLDDEAFLLDRDSGERIAYSSGRLDVIPALTTNYFGVVVPRMNTGRYQAIISNFPGADDRLSFELTKN